MSSLQILRQTVLWKNIRLAFNVTEASININWWNHWMMLHFFDSNTPVFLYFNISEIMVLLKINVIDIMS